MKALDRLLFDLPATPRPLLVPGVRLRALVDQVNRNTIRLEPPRSGPADSGLAAVAAEVDGVTIVDTPQAAIDALTDALYDEIWNEIKANTVTVRVENPEDSEQYVDVLRRTSSIFVRPDGRFIGLTFLDLDE